jgi:hypothetical protein
MSPNIAEQVADYDVDEDVEDLGDMDLEERGALLASIDRGLEQSARGEGRDARAVMAEFRERRSGLAR